MPDGKTYTVGENTSKVKKDKKGKNYALVMEDSINFAKGDTIRPGNAKVLKSKDGKDSYIQGGNYKAKGLGNKNYKLMSEISPNKASTGYTPYTPFKMKAADHDNSPMKKNFGVGEKESPKELDSPNKLFGAFGALMGRAKKQRMQRKLAEAQAQGQAKQEMAMANEAGAGGMDAPPQAEANMAAAQDPAAGGEGSVPPHGDEAHTGGAGPQGAGPQHNMAGFPKRKRRGFAGMMQRAGGLMGNLFSDIRLKENIIKTGVSKSGIPTYEFNYIGHAERYSGAMAQDLLAIKPDAVTLDASGYYKVNYNDIDVDMHLINN